MKSKRVVLGIVLDEYSIDNTQHELVLLMPRLFLLHGGTWYPLSSYSSSYAKLKKRVVTRFSVYGRYNVEVFLGLVFIYNRGEVA